MHLRVGHHHSQFWPILARFMDYYSVLGPRSDFHNGRTPGCIYVSVINTHNFGQFWFFSCTITHCFGVLERFPRLTIPGVHLCVGHRHSQFWPTLPRFMDYYSLFWCLGAISMIDAPRGALTCCSPAILISFDSGLFHGLLLTILGSQSYFHD